MAIKTNAGTGKTVSNQARENQSASKRVRLIWHYSAHSMWVRDSVILGKDRMYGCNFTVSKIGFNRQQMASDHVWFFSIITF
jgi:hypothetical protein